MRAFLDRLLDRGPVLSGVLWLFWLTYTVSCSVEYPVTTTPCTVQMLDQQGQVMRVWEGVRSRQYGVNFSISFLCGDGQCVVLPPPYTVRAEEPVR